MPTAESAVATGIGSPILWGVFAVIILFTLILDLGVFHRKAHRIGPKEALAWFIVWVVLAVIFNGYLFWKFGAQPGMEFLTGYLLEKALSVDNIFVFILIFSFFRVPDVYQHRVLFWGIIGAVIMRAVFILLGKELVEKFHQVLYLFGMILVITGGKILFKRDEEPHPEKNPIRRLFRKFIPMTSDFEGQKFIVRHEGKLLATPLLMVLVMIEASDVVFAIDSIPAVFGVTTDAFIIYTSNIFAILGLRSMFFLIGDIMDRFRYLKIGLGLVLVFIGVKMLLPIFEIKVDVRISLGVVIGLLSGCILTSLAVPVGKRKKTA